VETASRLHRNIGLSVAAYLVTQGALYGAAAAGLGLAGAAVYGYYAASTAFHGLMLLFLLWRSGDLRTVPDGKALERINLPCHLTLIRLSSTPTVVFLAANTAAAGLAPVLVGFVAVVFATDFLDGRIARRRGQTTVMGGYLDSSSDYAILLALGIVFTVQGLVPGWYAAVLLARLGVHAAGMGLLTLLRGRLEPETTFLGKVAVFAAMATFAFQLSRGWNLPLVGQPTLVGAIEILTAVILAVSLVEKILYLGRRLTELRAPRPGAP
jgi:CDP-diacylglycerol--glycerol-3-phosphate 3-phosphatidyltransferase